MQLLASMRRPLLLVLCASLVISVVLLTVTSKVGETNNFIDDDPGNANRLLAQDATVSQGTSTQNEEIIPAERMTTWNPGLNAMGGIPSDDDIPHALSARRLAR